MNESTQHPITRWVGDTARLILPDATLDVAEHIDRGVLYIEISDHSGAGRDLRHLVGRGGEVVNTLRAFTLRMAKAHRLVDVVIAIEEGHS